MTELPRRIAELFDYMDGVRERLLETSGSISPALASIRPTEGSWSVAEIMAHLAKVETGVAGLIEKSVVWARANGIGPVTSDSSVMASLDTFRIADNPIKLTAPDIVIPDAGKTMEESLASLGQSRARLKAALAGGADLDLTQVKRAHRVVGEVDMYQWALFVAQHEERHRAQIERTIGDVTERCAECAPIV
jgi:uncharacterized damage-inducible protein DinB